ncbi:MAG: hydroxymethylbilane synthase [Deinococcota bacterium]
MSRIVLGNSGSTLALQQTRTVLAELTEEWPDLNIIQHTIRGATSAEDVLTALTASKLNIAVLAADTLPLTLPEDVTVAAISKRLEPRNAIISKGIKQLNDLADQSHVGVRDERDKAFLLTRYPNLIVHVLTEDFEAHFNRISSDELAALVLPAAALIRSGHRQHIEGLLEADIFIPCMGQGALALVVRGDDDLAFETAYTLQHRPSFDRVQAERSFAAALSTHSALGEHTYAVGALATVSSEGDMTLFGAVTDPSEHVTIQAEISGEARESVTLGKELAQDVLGQLASLS